MRRLIVSSTISLDGFIAGPNGELDWSEIQRFPLDEEFGQCAREMVNSIDGILLGRRAYETLVNVWPSAARLDPVVKDRVNALPKFVFSRTLSKVQWGAWDNARLVKESVDGEVKRMKQEEGRDLAVLGSGELVSSLAKLGLIDEYQLFVQPILLGSGIPQFKGLEGRSSLSLVRSTQFRSGVVGLWYRPLGPGQSTQPPPKARIYLPKIPGLTPQLRAKAYAEG